MAPAPIKLDDFDIPLRKHELHSSLVAGMRSSLGCINPNSSANCAIISMSSGFWGFLLYKRNLNKIYLDSR